MKGMQVTSIKRNLEQRTGELGHDLSEWMHSNASLDAHCQSCLLHVVVYPYQWDGSAKVYGLMLETRCGDDVYFTHEHHDPML